MVHRRLTPGVLRGVIRSAVARMPRYPSSSAYGSSFAFGPGPLSTLLKALVAANVGVFLAQQLLPALTTALGLAPAAVVEDFRVWQLGTYMFLHGGVFHLLFNMLALWMFGTELERIWGTRYFLKFYFVTGDRRRGADGARLPGVLACPVRLGRHRRVWRDLRPVAGVCLVLS